MLNYIPDDLKCLIKMYSPSRRKNNLAQAAQGRSAVSCPVGCRAGCAPGMAEQSCVSGSAHPWFHQ